MGDPIRNVLLTDDATEERAALHAKPPVRLIEPAHGQPIHVTDRMIALHGGRNEHLEPLRDLRHAGLRRNRLDLRPVGGPDHFDKGTGRCRSLPPGNGNY